MVAKIILLIGLALLAAAVGVMFGSQPRTPDQPEPRPVPQSIIIGPEHGS